MDCKERIPQDNQTITTTLFDGVYVTELCCVYLIECQNLQSSFFT